MHRRVRPQQVRHQPRLARTQLRSSDEEDEGEEVHPVFSRAGDDAPLVRHAGGHRMALAPPDDGNDEPQPLHYMEAAADDVADPIRMPEGMPVLVGTLRPMRSRLPNGGAGFGRALS